MKKSVKFSLVITLICALLIPLAACGGHTHNMAWKRTGTEHWQACLVEGCTKETKHEKHTGAPCTVCGSGFKALAFGNANGNDPAHNDFVKEANAWFPKMGEQMGFTYEYSEDFSLLNDGKLAQVDLIIFLNERPVNLNQQAAFKKFMDNGGAWMGFHVCTACWVYGEDKNDPAKYWKWFHDEFVGSGNHSHNTWNPTSEPMRVEDGHKHFTTVNLPDVFVAAPCEWYAWEYDVTENPDITVLLTLNPTEDNPAGDSEGEIWYDGSYPIAWTNNNYNMVYMNWGHNLQDYNDGAEGTQSRTFSSEWQNHFMIEAMFNLVGKKQA